MTWTFWIALAFAIVGCLSVGYLLITLGLDLRAERRERDIKRQLAVRYRADAELFKVVKGIQSRGNGR